MSGEAGGPPDRARHDVSHGQAGEDGPVRPVEDVVLLDASGEAVGTMPKSEVHHGATPLHLAFSAYLFAPDGALLLTRRAERKRTFPGLWTNSVCGHPAPGEGLTDAVRRRARTELGLDIVDLRLVLPGYAYRAEMDGVVEHEMCPVHVGWTRPGAVPAPDPGEVATVAWVPWRELVADVRAGRRELSPWGAEQVRLLDALGETPAQWPAGDPGLLPPAARRTP